MSRLSDLLNPAPDSPTRPLASKPTEDQHSHRNVHTRYPSLSSPLEALVIAASNSPTEAGARVHGPTPGANDAPRSSAFLGRQEAPPPDRPKLHERSTPEVGRSKPAPVSTNIDGVPHFIASQVMGVANDAAPADSQIKREEAHHDSIVDARPPNQTPTAASLVHSTSDSLLNQANSPAFQKDESLSRPDSLPGSAPAVTTQSSLPDESSIVALKNQQPDRTMQQADAHNTAKELVSGHPSEEPDREEIIATPANPEIPPAEHSPSILPSKEDAGSTVSRAGGKKGTASVIKKPAAKKRKIEAVSKDSTPASQRSGTPISRAASKPPALKARKGSSATPARSSSPTAVNEDEDELDENSEVFCICRKPDDHTWMIGCDGGCEDWFHGHCINIDQSDENLIDKYICEYKPSYLHIA